MEGLRDTTGWGSKALGFRSWQLWRQISTVSLIELIELRDTNQNSTAHFCVWYQGYFQKWLPCRKQIKDRWPWGWVAPFNRLAAQAAWKEDKGLATLCLQAPCFLSGYLWILDFSFFNISMQTHTGDSQAASGHQSETGAASSVLPILPTSSFLGRETSRSPGSPALRCPLWTILSVNLYTKLMKPFILQKLNWYN